jgi:hypothetical protein
MSGKIEKGSTGFSEDYWQENYADASEMDGIANAAHHAAHLQHLFALELVDISSVIDFGFGLGHLFEEMLKAFVPYRAHGIEPSRWVFDQVKARGIQPVESTKLKLECIDLVTWAQKITPQARHFDLGLCTSVFQYLSDEELEIVLPVMARQVKYLYFSVPTDKELKRQREELEFNDRYAVRRSRSAYLSFLRPHFTIVSSRLLESRVHFPTPEDSFFTDYLFRF